MLGGESRSRIEIWAAVLLGLAGIATAGAAFFASLRDGEALEGYTKSNATRNDSSFFYQQGNQAASEDRAQYLQYQIAIYGNNVALAGYIRDALMSENLRAAVNWYEVQPETTTAVDPFDVDNGSPYETADYAEGEVLQKQSDDAFAAAKILDDTGDRYSLATVVFAIALFFGGIATLLRSPPVQVALVVMGAVALVAGGVQMLLLSI